MPPQNVGDHDYFPTAGSPSKFVAKVLQGLNDRGGSSASRHTRTGRAQPPHARSGAHVGFLQVVVFQVASMGRPKRRAPSSTPAGRSGRTAAGVVWERLGQRPGSTPARFFFWPGGNTPPLTCARAGTRAGFQLARLVRTSLGPRWRHLAGAGGRPGTGRTGSRETDPIPPAPRPQKVTARCHLAWPERPWAGRCPGSELEKSRRGSWAPVCLRGPPSVAESLNQSGSGVQRHGPSRLRLHALHPRT